jgi:hypothetical protein
MQSNQLLSIIQTLRWDLVLAKGLMIDGEMVSKLWDVVSIFVN